MPTRPDFYCRYEPSPKHDIALLLPRFESPRKAMAYSAKRISELRKGASKARVLADILEACGGDEGYCLSPACPVCHRHHRRWIVSEILRILKGRRDTRMVTIIMPQQRAALGRLHTLNAKAMLDTLHRQLDRAGISGLVAMGQLDVTLEIDRRPDDPNPPAWQPHIHLIVSGATEEAIHDALARHYPATKKVKTPIRIDSVRDFPEQISYCFKAVYWRRVSYINTDGEPDTGFYPLQE